MYDYKKKAREDPGAITIHEGCVPFGENDSRMDHKDSFQPLS